MANKSLTQAKNAKNDEFYTQWADIEREVNAYLEYDPDVFRGKTVLCPCDDPEWSNFTKFFALRFHAFGLKKLISTSFAVESKFYPENYQPTLFEMNDPKFDKDKTRIRGKIFVLDSDVNRDGVINIDDLQWDYLLGNGDFRSEEVTKLLAEVDIISTNPPFSLFREFVAWAMGANKKFLIIGSMNAIAYKEIFPLIMKDKVWLGANTNRATTFTRQDGTTQTLGNTCWFTNLDHGRRHEPLELMTMSNVFKHSKHKEVRGKVAYDRYDNYDAIEVPFTDAIPADYEGVMGVPISFLDKYCPEQFEIMGITKTWFGGASKKYPDQIQVNTTGRKSTVSKLNDGATLKLDEPPQEQTYYMVNGEFFIQLYARVLIKKKGITQ